MGVSVEVVEDYLKYTELSDSVRDVVMSTLPGCLPVDECPSCLYVPWTYENAAWLTTVKLPSISPFLRDYTFPCPADWKVMEHQMRIGEFMTRHRRGFVLAGMGSGKTASAIWATDYLLDVGQIKKVLVICPVAVAYDAWIPSIPMLLLHKYGVTNLHKNKNAYKEDTEYHIINIDKIDDMIDQLLTVKYDAVIVDESTKVKNITAKRTKGVRKLIAQAKFAWELTGKPTPQGPMDAHGQIWVMGVHSFSKSWWESATMVDFGNFRKAPRDGWQDVVHKYMQPAIRVETRDCVDLPPVTYTRHFIPLTPVQEQAIKALKKDKAIYLAGREVTSLGAGVLLQKIGQIAAGAVYDDVGEIVEVKATKRLEATLDLVEQSEGKTIVFVPFKHSAKLVTEFLRSKGYHVGMITSDVTHRQPIFDSFQNRNSTPMDVLVAVPDAMAHGVTLTEASTVVWYGPPRSNEIYQQANARADRKGQKRHVVVAELWGHPRERDMFDLARIREDDQGKFMELYRRVKSEMQKEFS